MSKEHMCLKWFRPLAFAGAVSVIPLSSLAQEACSTYAFKEGDTLASIAMVAYGTVNYQMIFNANRETLGSGTANIAVGTELVLPCLDGSLSQSQSLNSVIEEQTAIQSATVKERSEYTPPVKLAAANGWEPFVGESMTGGGMLVRLATTALNRGGNQRDHKLAYVDDIMSHLDTLLPTGAFDISIAWEHPDCSKIDILSAEMQRRCTDFDFSDPIYEIAEGFYTLPGNKYENVRTFAEYEGARMCRPIAWGTSDLEEEGLMPPFIDMHQPNGVVDCVEALKNGDVDVFTIEIETAVAYLTQEGMMDQVVQNPNITKFLPLAFITAKSNKRGKEYLGLLNKGLAEMRETGEWYDIVATSLADYNKLAGQ